MSLREAAQMALEALEDSHQNINPERIYAEELTSQISCAITALRAALAEDAVQPPNNEKVEDVEVYWRRFYRLDGSIDDRHLWVHSPSFKRPDGGITGDVQSILDYWNTAKETIEVIPLYRTKKDRALTRFETTISKAKICEIVREYMYGKCIEGVRYQPDMRSASELVKLCQIVAKEVESRILNDIDRQVGEK